MSGSDRNSPSFTISWARPFPAVRTPVHDVGGAGLVGSRLGDSDQQRLQIGGRQAAFECLPGTSGQHSPDPLGGPIVTVGHLATSQTPPRPGIRLQLAALIGHAAGMRIHTVRRRDWQDYREIRLAALKDAPSAFSSTWQEEASLTAPQWEDRAQRSQDGETRTMVAAVDDTGRWVGLAGGYRPGDRGADTELISMWVTPECRASGIGMELLCAVMTWAEDHGASTVGLWVNAANQPAISLYERAGFARTGETDKLPSNPAQQEIRMMRRTQRERSGHDVCGRTRRSVTSATGPRRRGLLAQMPETPFVR
jgi:RimJ/RimL family protein N-acetyltransferase